MSGNTKEVYSSTEALAALIEATKAHQKKYDLMLPNIQMLLMNVLNFHR